MKDSRKYLAGLAAAGFVMAVTAPGSAAFTSKGTQTVSASATIGGTPTIAITGAVVKNISDNATAGGVTWSGVTPGYSANGGWKVSDQYIQLTANINTANGGIQIYTDNMASDASPKFTGDRTAQTPAGLINANNTAQKLPTAWRASTQTFHAADAALTPIDPNATGGFNWFYHEDKSQVAIPSQNAAAFANGNAYSTVYSAPNTLLTGETVPVVAGGPHYASGLDPATNQQQFGPFTNGTSVTNIYTEANFSSALAGTSYGTNKIILEAFSL